MSIIEKLINKIFSDLSITYRDAENLLLNLGFELKIKGSHHIFRKKGYINNIALKKRKELFSYQINQLKQVLLDHGYKKN